MTISEEELRAMVRESVVRHLAAASPARPAFPSERGHPVFARLPLARGSDDDGACLIEPLVRCTHCGYCQSYGH
jgi:hypothetical protein